MAGYALAGAVGLGAIPGIASLFHSRKSFPQTYAARQFKNAQQDPGLRNAYSASTYQPNESAYQFNPELAGKIQDIAGGLAGANYQPSQVGGGLAGTNFQQGSDYLNQAVTGAQNYASSPLVSALAQQQGLAQAQAAQRAAAVSGPMQFNQALAGRNAALAGNNLYANVISQGQLAQMQEQQMRQKFLTDVLGQSGVGLGNIGQQVQYGQAQNATNGLEANRQNLIGQTSAADIYGNLGHQQMAGAMTLDDARRQQANLQRQGLIDYYQGQLAAAGQYLQGFNSYNNTNAPLGQQLAGAGASALANLAYLGGNAFAGKWNNTTPAPGGGGAAPAYHATQPSIVPSLPGIGG